MIEHNNIFKNPLIPNGYYFAQIYCSRQQRLVLLFQFSFGRLLASATINSFHQNRIKRGLYRINRYKPQDEISVNHSSYTILRYSNHHIVNPGRLTCALDSYP